MSFTISNKNGVLLNSPRNNESWLSIVLKGLETQHQPWKGLYFVSGTRSRVFDFAIKKKGGLFSTVCLGPAIVICLWPSPVTFLNRINSLKIHSRASLVAQWLRVCLPMQGTWVRALVWEDPTCRGATKPVSHKYWACASGACAPRQERPRQWEARAPRWRVAPACRN